MAYARADLRREIHIAGRTPPQVTTDGRSIDEIKKELADEWAGDQEEAARKHEEWLDACVRMTAFELGRRLQGREKGKTMTGAPAVIVECVDAFLREKGFDGTPITELLPPVELRQPIRKRPAPPMIDGDDDGTADGSNAAEPVEAAAPADTQRTVNPPSLPATVPAPRSRVVARYGEHGVVSYVREDY